MRDPATLRALAARVQAEEPSRELEHAVALAAGWRLKTVDGFCYWRRGDNSWTQEDADYPPSYLTSLDASASLVPAGWASSLYWGHYGEGSKGPLARLYLFGAEGEMRRNAYAHARTPPQALTAAALLALAAEEEARRGE